VLGQHSLTGGTRVTSRWRRRDVAIVIPPPFLFSDVGGPRRRAGLGGVVAMRPRTRPRICAVHASNTAHRYILAGPEASAAASTRRRTGHGLGLTTRVTPFQAVPFEP
jgi:hypothetical protein